MKTNIGKLKGGLVLAAMLTMTQAASAFYEANLGRWINRDPLGDNGSVVHFAAKFEPEVGPSTHVLVTTGPFESWGGANLHGYVGNNPINFVDPFGLSSIHTQIASAIARGDVAALETLLGSGALTEAQAAMVQAALNKYRSTAVQWIAQNCKGSIGREFPSQFYNKTLEQIKNLKDAGDAAAKKAWKLLNDSRFKK